MISERTKAALGAAKRRGVKLGAPQAIERGQAFPLPQLPRSHAHVVDRAGDLEAERSAAVTKARRERFGIPRRADTEPDQLPIAARMVSAIVRQVFRARFLVARPPQQLRQPRDVEGDPWRLIAIRDRLY
jgi:hypothetical protein